MTDALERRIYRHKMRQLQREKRYEAANIRQAKTTPAF